MTTNNTDIQTVLSEPTEVILLSGRAVLVQRLKTRQLMKLMKILTRGAGQLLGEMSFGGDDDDSLAQLAGAVIFSIPEAEDETIEFVRSMVLPAGLIDPQRTKTDAAHNAELLETLAHEFDNPELEDLLSVVEAVVVAETPHLKALGKRLAAMLKLVTNNVAASQSNDSKTTSGRSTRKV